MEIPERARAQQERCQRGIVRQFDVMTVVDAPDDATLTALLLSAGALGNLHTQSLRAFSADEMGKIVDKMV